MEERYEIRGKIGQGGLGAVYRGYDTRMNRDVAIKRISVGAEDHDLQEESTRQLMKEAGALASLQHPNIVTIYDVGMDEDGPYVVMELISGKTLDELIERAPLTWGDFCELALQTQEALIAAQELDLIHSDLKPSNLMLTWLPSGKFQVKTVDFGLATLTQNQSLEELQEIEAVFGSIFFMAPEQFKRVPIDSRTDMYAMGCVYYQALTGIYPFRGETGEEVMASHLHHAVIPLQDLRPNIPLWACDWVMWHINLEPDDRPESARQALHVFLENQKTPNPTMSLGQAQPVIPAGPRPRLAIPQAGTMPGSPNRRVIPAAGAPRGPVAAPAPEVSAGPPPVPKIVEPMPLEPPEGSKPRIHTSQQILPDVTPSGQLTPSGRLTPTSPLAATQAGNPTRQFTIQRGKKKKGNGLKIAIALLMLVIAGVLGFFLMKQVKASNASKRDTILLEQAADPKVAELPMSGAEFGTFLKAYADATSNSERETLVLLLNKAVRSDDTDFDATLVTFATTYPEMLPEVREELIRKVVTPRLKPEGAAPLVEFARTSNDTASAVAALEAVKTTAGPEQLGPLLSVIQFHPKPEMRKAAEDAASGIVARSGGNGQLLAQIDDAIASSDGEAKKALERVKAAR